MRSTLRFYVVLSGPKDPWLLTDGSVPQFAYELIRGLDAKFVRFTKNVKPVPVDVLAYFLGRLVEVRSIGTRVWGLCGGVKHNVKFFAGNGSIKELVVTNESAMLLGEDLLSVERVKWVEVVPNWRVVKHVFKYVQNAGVLDLSDIELSSELVESHHILGRLTETLMDVTPVLPPSMNMLRLNSAMVFLFTRVGFYRNGSQFLEKFANSELADGYLELSEYLPWGTYMMVSLTKLAPMLQFSSLVINNARLEQESIIDVLKSGPFINLKVIELESFATSEEILISIGRSAPNLSRLQAWTNATDVGLRSVSIGCRGLVELDVTGSAGVTDDGMESVGEFLSGLELLKVAMCYKITDNGVEYIARRCRRLQELELCETGVTDVGVGFLAGKARTGNTESGSDTEVDDDDDDAADYNNRAAESPFGCPELTYLSLCWCTQIRGTTLPDLAKHCPNLTHLRTAQSSIPNETFETHLPLFKNLETANLSYHDTKSDTITNEAVSEATTRPFTYRTVTSVYGLTELEEAQYRSNWTANALMGEPTVNLTIIKFRSRKTHELHAYYESGFWGDRGTGSLHSESANGEWAMVAERGREGGEWYPNRNLARGLYACSWYDEGQIVDLDGEDGVRKKVKNSSGKDLYVPIP